MASNAPIKHHIYENADYFTLCVDPVNDVSHKAIVDNWLKKNTSTDETPLFFEQFSYRIKVMANEGYTLKFIHHRQSMVDSLTAPDEPNRLSGVINFRNDVGLFEFAVESLNTSTNQVTITPYIWDVYPRKLNSKEDYRELVTRVNEKYPSWIWSATPSTQHEATLTNDKNELSVIWLQLFYAIGEQYIKSVQSALNAPHNKLAPQVKYLRADRIGKVRGKDEERIKEGLARSVNTKFRIEKQISTQNTYENRWLKFSVKDVKKKLSHVLQVILSNSNDLGISDNRLQFLRNQQKKLESILRHSVLKTVGEFRALDRESLVLHHRYGYAGAYRYWLMLKKQLELLENSQYRIGLKQVSDLYEVWCLLEVKNILCGDEGHNGLGFKEKESKKASLEIRELELQLNKGNGASFTLENSSTGVSIRLAHEPRYKKPSVKRNSANSGIVSFTSMQKPDIWLEAQFPGGTKVVYVFDAKYRIQYERDSFNSAESSEDGNEVDMESNDLVPSDALNQMHRYRDAIIHLEGENDQFEYGERNRLVAGGFALYPGVYDQGPSSSKDNPYKESIEQIGIGAFPCLPSDDGTGSKWLELFLKEKFGQVSSNEVDNEAIELIDHPSVKIPHRGHKQYNINVNCTMIIPLGPKRSKEYVDSYKKGTAEFYHTKLFSKETNKGISKAKFPSIQFLAISIQGNIEHIYSVSSSKVLKRSEITQEQSGSNFINNSDEQYVLFAIKKYASLTASFGKPYSRTFHQYTDLATLVAVSEDQEFKRHFGK